jgi:ArsR family transcriptional regulator, arsenate/arsenite/antimonite-responsive transcriptional repressor
MDTKTALEALKSLAQDSRLAAYRLLVIAGPEGLSVGELREQIAIPAATLTAHLNQLRGAGLVLDQREGRVIRIRADYQRMNDLIAFLTDNCCAGASSVCSPSDQPCAPKPLEQIP